MIVGIDKLKLKLSQLLPEEEALKATRHAAEIIRSAITAPVDTGNLQRSIHTRKTSEGAAVYTNCEYAVYVEFGTGPKGQAGDHSKTAPIPMSYRQDSWIYKDPKTNKTYKTSGQAPQPFMYPAAHNPAVQKAVREDFNAQVLKRLRRMGK